LRPVDNPPPSGARAPRQKEFQMLVGRPAPDLRMVTTKDPNTLDQEATVADYRG